MLVLFSASILLFFFFYIKTFISRHKEEPSRKLGSSHIACGASNELEGYPSQGTELTEGAGSPTSRSIVRGGGEELLVRRR